MIGDQVTTRLFPKNPHINLDEEEGFGFELNEIENPVLSVSIGVDALSARERLISTSREVVVIIGSVVVATVLTKALPK